MDIPLQLSASPEQCSNYCSCYYFFEEMANIFDCSQTNITSLTELRIPNETMWLVARSSDIPYLQWTENLDDIQHLDLQDSGVFNVANDFFSEIAATKKTTFLNLANNYLKTFPKTLNGTSFSEVYLAGNPIDCNCDMLWFADWLNRTSYRSDNRIVRDYDKVLCAGGKWNGTHVYKLNADQMGCYPKNTPKWVAHDKKCSF